MGIRIKEFLEGTIKARARRRTARLDEDGRELGDSTPMSPPVGYKREPTIAERIRTMVRSEALAQAAAAAGKETFEEADDFDVPDDDTFDPATPYEEVFEPPAPPTGVGGGGTAPAPGDAPSNSNGPAPAAASVPAATASTPEDGDTKK